MSKAKKIILSIIMGASIGTIISSGLFVLNIHIQGKFQPETKISGIDVSHKTPKEAEELLEERKKQYLSTPLKLTANGSVKEITPEELGIDILVGKTIQIAEEINSTKTSLLNWFLSHGRTEPITIDLMTSVDHEQLITKIYETFNLEDLAPSSANFYFDENYRLAIKEGKAGMALNEEKLLQDIKSSAKQLKPNSIELVFENQQPNITKEMLENQIESVRESLNHEFVLIDPIYSDDWYEKLIDHLDWVKFEEKKTVVFDPFSESEIKSNIKIEIDQNKLNEYIDEEISRWLDVPPEPLNIYTDENEEIIIEGKGNKGLKVHRRQLKQSIELAVANKIREVPIPVMELEPEINISEDLQEKGIKELIGVGHTSYYGSPRNRVHNIKTGASKFNGMLIEPDEIFSFNKNLGRVDASTGYRMELVIKAEGTIPEYGGGLCQVSTTMFRTVLFSGLPIVERNPHSYAVSYYSQILGHGLDATIYLGGSDLKFKNDTGHHILIQTYTKDDYELYIAFYGTSDGRSVEMEGPYLSNYHGAGPTVYIETEKLPPGQKKQVEVAHTGFNALWYRYITRPDGEVEVEPIKTAYRAVPAKILVGVADTPVSVP